MRRRNGVLFDIPSNDGLSDYFAPISPTNKANPYSDIPSEYKNDPELWFAIQESMKFSNDHPDVKPDDNLNGWDTNNNNNAGTGQIDEITKNVNDRKTPSTGDNISNKNNESMSNLNQSFFE